jgi:mycofactocin precursor peptide peptidase
MTRSRPRGAGRRGTDGVHGSATARSATTSLAHQRWPRVEQMHPLLLVPVGSVEQHGRHLPLATDTVIAGAVTRVAAERLTDGGVDVLVAPSVGYGASGEHEDFPGTVSIGHDALSGVLVELGRSACRWATGVVFVNGHGGNAATLARSVALLRFEGRAAAWTSCDVPGADAHAGHTETSLMRHLAPWAVRMDLAASGATDPVTALMPRLRAGGVASVTANGVLGDPSGSSPEHGRELFDRLVDTLVARLGQPDVADDGRLVDAATPAASTDPVS